MRWFYEGTVENQSGIDTLTEVFEARRGSQRTAVDTAARTIIDNVRLRKDVALLELTQQFDCPNATEIRVPIDAIDAACARIAGSDLERALIVARDRIYRFHMAHKRHSWVDDTVPGERMGQRIIPFRRVGIYVPGGRASYPSTVLMTAIPAMAAGVKHIIMCTPAQPSNALPSDGTLAAARLAGVTDVFSIGGAQAIAAMAYGTETVPRVDKIVGPGNAFVNAAKRMVYGDVGIDMLAGPSEVAVLLDDTADIEGAARELIAQTEHDPMNAALLVCLSESIRQQVAEAVERQLVTLPRAGIVRQALTEQSVSIVTTSMQLAIDVLDAFAPEHLHIDVHGAADVAYQVTNAGAILIGPYTTAAHGDYLAGPSHCLPTAGAARFSSPLNMDDFVKKSSLLYFDSKAAAAIAPFAATMATYEGLAGHARSAGLPGKVGSAL